MNIALKSFYSRWLIKFLKLLENEYLCIDVYMHILHVIPSSNSVHFPQSSVEQGEGYFKVHSAKPTVALSLLSFSLAACPAISKVFLPGKPELSWSRKVRWVGVHFYLTDAHLFYLWNISSTGQQLLGNARVSSPWKKHMCHQLHLPMPMAYCSRNGALTNRKHKRSTNSFSKKGH